MGNIRTNANAATLALCALYVLLPSYILPFIKMNKLGTEESFSLLNATLKLLNENNIGLGIVILIFSFAFPVAKIILIIICTTTLLPLQNKLRSKLHYIAEISGRFSMVDVFVIAILVVILKIDGMTEVAIGLGTALFATAVILTMIASLLVPHECNTPNRCRIHNNQPPGNTT